MSRMGLDARSNFRPGTVLLALLGTDALDGKRAYGSPSIGTRNLPNLTLNGSPVEY